MHRVQFELSNKNNNLAHKCICCCCCSVEIMVSQEKNNINFHQLFVNYHKRCKCKFLDKTERTSFVKRSASNNGNNDNRQMSIGSENHDFIGIALFGKHRYAPGELSIINIC